MTYFEPEFTQPDDLILVDGNYYGVFNVDGDDYSMPVLVFVDDTSALLEGATPSFVGTKAEWEEANNRLFVDIMDYSQIKNPENQTWEDLETSLERNLNRTAAKLGDWVFDDEIMNLYALSALTGQPVQQADIENTNYWLTTSQQERNWIQLMALAPEEANQLLFDNKASFNQFLFSQDVTGAGVEGLSTALSTAVSTGKISSGEAANIIKLLSDDVYRQISGGIDTIPPEYQGYLDTINSTRAGELSAEGLIAEYLGINAVQGFRDSGLLDSYAGMLRMDAANESNIMRNKIIKELQQAHDSMFPHFKGGKHSTWSAPFYQYFTQITKISPSMEDKSYIDNMARDFSGDFNAMGTKIRGDYIDTPGVKNDMISNMGRQFEQDLSAAY